MQVVDHGGGDTAQREISHNVAATFCLPERVTAAMRRRCRFAGETFR